ncbi:MAG: NAD-dependent epimerase/dehydratase family protein [Flavobacteriaceae bacterium]|nr:NAD-dependent epimerase/dehydratase family protein [Flavobacteriaceae bacterium]
MNKNTILIIGANGQLGSVLVKELQKLYGKENIIASDLNFNLSFDGVFEALDATDFDLMQNVVKKHAVTQIYHLAAILSATGEKNPLKTWEINMKMMLNVFEVSRLNKIEKVFFPSSIAVFGDAVLRENTPQSSFLNPATVYGMSKASGENWAQYYFLKYNLDIRSLRYPGIIGHQSLPGGGTTDYAVEIYHNAVKEKEFTCFLAKDTVLPMIFMEDAIRATIELMEAPKENIKTRTSYNIAGMSFSPQEIASEIKEIYPNFKINYNPDFRQKIAESWPKSIDDNQARKDWNWKPTYNLKTMTKVMLEKLAVKYGLQLTSCD